MFKVFRIKEEHSAFLSDGGGIGSRGLARVRPHHASLFPATPPLSVFLFPLVLLLAVPPSTCLLKFTLSLFPCRFFFFLLTCSLYLSLTLSTSLRFLLSLFLSPALHLSSSHLPSSIHLLWPSLSLSIHFYPLCTFLSFLLHSLHSTRASLSFPTEAHKADGYSNRL